MASMLPNLRQTVVRLQQTFQQRLGMIEQYQRMEVWRQYCEAWRKKRNECSMRQESFDSNPMRLTSPKAIRQLLQQLAGSNPSLGIVAATQG